MRPCGRSWSTSRASQEDAGLEATDAAYAEAFRAADLDTDALEPAEAAARLRRRPAAVVVELAAYLDHWSDVRRMAKRPATAWRKALEVARAADPDDYRDRLRGLLATADPKASAAQLKSLANEPEAAELPAPTAVLLAGALVERMTGMRPCACFARRWRGTRTMSRVNFAPGWNAAKAYSRAAGGGGALLHRVPGPASRDGARPGPPSRRDGPGRRGCCNLPRPGRASAQFQEPGLFRSMSQGPRRGQRGSRGPGPRCRRGAT